MRPLPTWAVIVLAALVARAGAAGDLYKCGVPGQIIYTDQPCKNLGATTLDVLTPKKLDDEMLTILPSGSVTPKPVQVSGSAAKLPGRPHHAARHHHSSRHHHRERRRPHISRRVSKHKIGRITSPSP
jgi:hypothetical protein